MTRVPIQSLRMLAAILGISPGLILAADPPDRPLKIVQTTDVRLPDSGDPDVPTRGEVRMVVHVDETGKLSDLLLVSSAHRMFTQAAVSALQEWRFEPAHRQGSPVGTRTVLRLHFHSRGRVVSVTGASVLTRMVDFATAAHGENRIATARELDAPLQLVASAVPRFPLELAGRLPERATVVLDFYIDETGQPRMPVAVHSSHPYLTHSALHALERWRFAPPTRERVPVIVHAQQEFVFTEPADAVAHEPAQDFEPAP